MFEGDRMGKKGNFKVIEEREFYKIGKSRGVIKISEAKDTKTKMVSFSKEVNKNGKWIPKRKKFFSVSFRWIGNIIDILLEFAKKFKWKVSASKKSEDEFKELKKRYEESLQKISEMEELIEKLKEEAKSYRARLEEYRKDVIRKNFQKFKKDIEIFEDLIKRTEKREVKEEDIQNFLKEHPWMFSPEYYNVTPKKPVGSKSVFDFYLEDYKGQGIVIELKKPSDKIFSGKEEFGLSVKCGIALGQLIRYVENTISYSRDVRIREIEKIKEIRPLGFLIIGKTKSKKEIEKVKILNSYLHMVQILSYDMLLLRAKNFIKTWEKSRR
ncbi:MAG: hypothetical protein B6U95_07595 [Thermofilum sp. ex4484_82]|nr:MAG: hypothetical protein B6U95_07595 [Thermofilum sp. ex4484_82]